MGRKFQFPHIVVIDQEIDRINTVFFFQMQLKKKCNI